MNVSSLKNVLVIGTSNTIVRGGWFDGFMQTSGANCHRIALGGAAFSQFLADVEDIAHNAHDLILIETSPNDESYPQSIGDPWVFSALYDSFIAKLCNKAKIAVLRIPPLSYLGVDSEINLMQKSICKRYGISYIDLSPIIKEISERNQMNAYRDKYHPTTEVAFETGCWLAQEFTTFSAVGLAKPESSGSSFFRETVSYGNEKIAIKTQIIQDEFSVMPIDVSYKLRKPSQCFGFFIAPERTNCIVRFIGIRENRDLFCFYKEIADRTKVVFVALPNGLFTSSIQVIRPWRVVDYGLHSTMHGAPYELAISSLICFDPGTH